MIPGKCRRGASVVLSLLVMAGCSAGSLTGDSGSGAATYEAVWINASWSGGATGAPFGSKAKGIGSNFTGSWCPAESLVLENHSSRYQSVFSNSRDVLVFKNNCGQPADLLVCATAGSGGNSSEFPVCNTDPRTTPLSRLMSVNMGGSGSGLQSTTWRQTGVNLDLNIFYCGVGDTFTVGAVAGAKPTDCLM